MFKFGFDIPTDEGGDGSDQKATANMPEANLRSGDGNETHADTSTTITISSKPAASVLNISDVISSVFESDTLFEYVSVVRDDSGGGNSGEHESIPAVKPLRRVVFPPDKRLPSSLRASNNAISTAEQPTNISSTFTEGEIIGKDSLADTDLIPGVYEGGLKVWECSLDLCRHLADEILRLHSSFEGGDGNGIDISANNDVYHALSKTGKTLELGCGHGLPACLIFRELRKRWQNVGMSDSVTEVASSEDGCSVLFSDYNEFVLRDATVPNIVLNMDSERPCPNDKREWEKVQGCVGCVSGDWIDLSNKLQTASLGDANETSSIPLPSDGRFDLILAAETTYTEESAMDTARLFGRHLRVATGVGLVATKRYYFGVGGGADAFRQAAADIVVQATANGDRRRDCRLSIETVKSYDSGVGRDLLRVRLVPVDLYHEG
mmetsp:Transcript_16994/g.37001  ORF Transcript_16994/g.37001 Transcript_16994/m.37001 type:complete len:436 (-) Transcript_16994:143-1450(-)